MILTRDAILSVQDLKTKEIHVAEWGGTVRIMELSGSQRLLFEESVTDQGVQRSPLIVLCALSLVNENGERLFSLEDMEQIGNKSTRALRAVFDAAVDLNGLRKDDEALDEAKKPLETTGSDGFASS